MPPLPPNPNRYVDVIDEIADFLSTNLQMTMGSNFFVGDLPEAGTGGTTVQDALYLVENPGPPPDMYIDTETHLFDVWSTSSSTSTAKVLQRRVYDILQRKGNYPLKNWYIYFSYANSTIRDEGRGREGNKLFSQSFTIICRNLNNIS